MFTFEPLTTTDVIQIIGIIISLITSIVAIVISVKTLKQNSEMIEESTRPYLVIYGSTTNFQSPNLYIALKNFGQTGATITSLSCNYDLRKYSYNSEYIPFSHMEGTTVAPGQSFLCNLNPCMVYEEPIIFEFSIEYLANGKTYSETFSVNPKAHSDLVQTRASTKDAELKIISYTLQSLVERFL